MCCYVARPTTPKPPNLLQTSAKESKVFLLSLTTGMLGLIIVFPVLGHGTWHAYRAVADDAAI